EFARPLVRRLTRAVIQASSLRRPANGPAWLSSGLVFGGTARLRRLIRAGPQFRTIQVRPKDLGALPEHPEPAVSWHSGFRGGAHARHKASRVHHTARRSDSRVAARGACAAASDASDRVPRLQIA